MDYQTAERDKYQRMWRIDDYRRNAPGEKLVEDAIRRLALEPGATVLDFGCGTGRAAQRFDDLGYPAAGIDIAPNCLDPHVTVPFIEGCLWDLPDLPPVSLGYCTDVMEHIPGAMVMDVLRGIQQLSRVAYFQICTRPDGMGRLIGETLHLTVRPADWWGATLQHVWDRVDLDAQGSHVIAWCK